MAGLGGATARVVKGITRIRPTRSALTLTPEAVGRVKELMKKQPDMIALKVGVRHKGCNGLTYTLDYAQEKAKFDEEVVQVVRYIPSSANLKYRVINKNRQLAYEIYPNKAANEDGVKIWVDPKAQLSLLGTEMDYVTNKLSSEFVFRNPNIKGTCGCGESFNL